MIIKIICIIIISILLIIGSVMLFAKYQMSKVHTLSFEEALGYTTANNKDAIISVGVIKNQKASFKVYGCDGKALPSEVHTYEIGSVTKTFTAALVSKAIQEKNINLDDTVDAYLALPQDKKYPTIRQLLTHTSGYKAHYFEKPMISNFFARRNDFYGITKEIFLDRVAAIDLSSKKKSFRYSNFVKSFARLQNTCYCFRS